MFAVLDATIDELAQVAPLVRFAKLTVVRFGDLRTLGFRIDPTGRNPGRYDIGFDSLDAGIASTMSCAHRTIDHVYFEGEP